MAHFSKTIFVLCVFSALTFSQWVSINPYPTSSALKSMKFIDKNIGWVSGYNGTIIKTTDGGENWTKQIISTENQIHYIDFIDQNFGWVVGDG